MVEPEYPFPEERIFLYQGVQELLSVVIDQPYFEFTIGELATLFDDSLATVSKAVKLLSSVGVVQTRREGRNQYVEPHPTEDVLPTRNHDRGASRGDGVGQFDRYIRVTGGDRTGGDGH